MHINGIERGQLSHLELYIFALGENTGELIEIDRVHFIADVGKLRNALDEISVGIEFSYRCNAHHVCGLTLSIGGAIAAFHHDQNFGVCLVYREVGADLTAAGAAFAQFFLGDLLIIVCDQPGGEIISGNFGQQPDPCACFL